MTSKKIKQLAIASFTRGNIEPKKVLKVVSKLKRSELREYIKFLKAQISKSTVRVQVPNIEQMDGKELKTKFSRIFPDKKIVIEQNPELLLGVKVIDDDKIYDFNLKDSFEEMSEQIREI